MAVVSGALGPWRGLTVGHVIDYALRPTFVVCTSADCMNSKYNIDMIDLFGVGDVMN